MAETIRDVVRLFRPLVFLERGADLAKARTLLELHAVSRLPVLEGGRRKVIGMVRRKRLHAALLGAQPPKELADVLSTSDVQVIDWDSDIFTATERLHGHEELLVRGANGEITHLLTPRALADWWATYATPFRVVEDVERALRGLLAPLEGTRLLDACGKEKLEDFNPADYETAVRTFWNDLPVHGFSRDETCRWIREFVECRNRLMHFRSRGLSEHELSRMRGLAAFIRARLPG